MEAPACYEVRTDSGYRSFANALEASRLAVRAAKERNIVDVRVYATTSDLLFVQRPVFEDDRVAEVARWMSSAKRMLKNLE
jgi:hypothetical protein